MKVFSNTPKSTYLRSYFCTGKEIGKNFGWLFIGNFGSLALGFITTLYLARVLGQAQFGKFSYAQTLAIYGAIIVDLGLNVYGNRSVANSPKHAGRYLANIGSIQVLSGLLLIIVVTTIVHIFNFWSDRELQAVVSISFIWVLPFALNIEWFFLGLQRMNAVASGRLIQQGIIIVVTFLLVKDPGQVVYAPLARVAGGIVSALWLLYQLPKGIFQNVRIHLFEATAYLRTSKWFWFSAFLVQVYNGTDIVILQMFRTASEVGLYSAAFRLIGLFVAAISVLNMAMFPMLAAEHSKISAALTRLLKLYLLAACCIALMLLGVGIPAAPLLVQFAYGEEFLDSVPMLKILIVAASVLTINGALTQPLLATGNESSVFKIILASAVINLVLNAVLIPHFGAYGAAWVYVISTALSTVGVLLIYFWRVVLPYRALLIERR